MKRVTVWTAMKAHRITRAALLFSVALGAGITLSRPQTLRAQGETPQPLTFLVLATGSQETPSVDSPGVASGRLTMSADRKQLSFDLMIADLKGKLTGIHLHRGRAGQDGPVVYSLPEPVEDEARGQVEFNPADEADLLTQGFYLDLHTDLFPNGELRGQVVRDPTPPPVSLARQIQPIFKASCACHLGGFSAAGVSLDDGDAYASLVSVPSGQSELNLVDPGDPEKSYLIHKLRGTQRQVGGSGKRMPEGGSLSQAKIRLIERWILQGAPDN
jgi:CHRD domain